MQRIIRLITASLVFIMLPAQAAQVAGEVTAAMGEAQIVASAGGQRAAAQGVPLHVGDILQTGAGGHIHIRMVDDALVSLRPNSKLRITSYAYQAGVAGATQIRLDLLHGTVRSVTGKGGELAKDRFRMNTPVAAIGVRGTDFITQADAEKTLVHVAAGAIVLAPWGVGCQENALGSCQTAAARVLTADMLNMMLELTRGMAEPRLVPLSDKLQITAPQAAAEPFIKPQLHAQASADASSQVSVDAGWQKQTLNSLAEQQIAAVQPLPVEPPPAVQPPPVEPPPAVQPPPPIPVHYQMVWGRWSWVAQGNDLGVPFMEAAQGREVTVGSSMSGLFRDRSAPMLLPQSGRTDFALRMAQVSLPQTGGAIAGQVQNGTLGVDFNAKRFDTQLNIQHPSLSGAVALNAAGILRDDGILLSTASGSNGLVAGSLSRDGAEAGYLFDLPTAAGILSGTTLWIK